jgi:hypothetical protein
MSGYYVVEPCTTAGGVEIKLERKIDLAKAEGALSAVGKVVASSPVVLLLKVDGLSVSVYGSGRMMVKGKNVGVKEGKALAGKLVPALEAAGALI